MQFSETKRLQEARRMVLGENLDVANASTRVGYEDPSYFSREYKKMFGAPPQRDIAAGVLPRGPRQEEGVAG